MALRDEATACVSPGLGDSAWRAPSLRDSGAACAFPEGGAARLSIKEERSPSLRHGGTVLFRTEEYGSPRWRNGVPMLSTEVWCSLFEDGGT